MFSSTVCRSAFEINFLRQLHTLHKINFMHHIEIKAWRSYPMAPYPDSNFVCNWLYASQGAFPLRHAGRSIVFMLLHSNFFMSGSQITDCIHYTGYSCIVNFLSSAFKSNRMYSKINLCIIKELCILKQTSFQAIFVLLFSLLVYKISYRYFINFVAPIILSHL